MVRINPFDQRKSNDIPRVRNEVHRKEESCSTMFVGRGIVKIIFAIVIAFIKSFKLLSVKMIIAKTIEECNFNIAILPICRDDSRERTKQRHSED